MEDSLLLPREVSLRDITFKKRHHHHSATCSMSMNSEEDASSSQVSSLENSGFLCGLESGFESFRDFLEYSVTPIQAEPWRRRRKYLRMKSIRRGLWLASRWLQGGLYGLCRVVLFSIINIGVAVVFLLFLVF